MTTKQNMILKTGSFIQDLGIFSMYEELGLEEWYDPSAYRIVYDRLKKAFSNEQIYLSQKGFSP